MTMTDKEFVIRTMIECLQKYLASEFPDHKIKFKSLKELCLSANFIDYLFLNGMSLTSTAIISKKQTAKLLNITGKHLMEVADFLTQHKIISYSDKNEGDKLMVRLTKFPDEVYATLEDLYKAEIST